LQTTLVRLFSPDRLHMHSIADTCIGERKRAVGRVKYIDGPTTVADVEDRVIFSIARMLILAGGMGEDGVATVPEGYSNDKASILKNYEATLYAIYHGYPSIKAGTYSALMSDASYTKTLYIPASTLRVAVLTSIPQDFGCSCIHHESTEEPV
jgi:hypothetical protein